MARISRTTKERYTKLDEGSEVCFYDGAPASMEDMTPSPSASEADREIFPGEWARVNCCRRCWGKIYTANIANAGMAFGVLKGLMTIEQKRTLIGGTVSASAKNGIVLGFDKQWYVPAGTMLMGDHFLVGSTKMHVSEVMSLQPAFALKIMNRPVDHIRMALNQAFASGNLDVDDQAKYEEMLDI